MAIIQYDRGSRVRLQPNFTRKEFDCKCGCSPTKHDTALSAGAQKLRDLFGEISVNSGYRCAKHDKAVGGSGSGQHVKGRAADLACANVNPVCMAIVAYEKKLFKGIGIYWYTNGAGKVSAFIHGDTRSVKCTWLRSMNGESYRYTTLKSYILPTISRGCSGYTNKAAVRMLQRLLGITADGSFGRVTEKALKEAQAKAGIKADGICGPESWRHLSGAIKYL